RDQPPTDRPTIAPHSPSCPLLGFAPGCLLRRLLAAVGQAPSGSVPARGMWLPALLPGQQESRDSGIRPLASRRRPPSGLGRGFRPGTSVGVTDAGGGRKDRLLPGRQVARNLSERG